MIQIIENFINSLIDIFTYNGLLLLKDFITFLLGLFTGYIIMIVKMATALRYLHTVETMEENVMIRLKEGSKTIFFANPKTWLESIQVALALVFKPILKGKTYTARDRRRSTIVLIILVVVFIILLALGILFLSISVLPVEGGDGYNIIVRFK